MALSESLQAIYDAVQAHANKVNDDPAMVTSVVVFWEERRFDDEGDMVYRTDYTTAAEASMANDLGTAMLGIRQMRRDIAANTEDDEL